MIDFLDVLLNSKDSAPQSGETAVFDWAYLGEGLLEFTPKQPYSKSVVLSAGVHGNETAPIELLSRLSLELFNGTLPLKVRLLCILGNPSAIRSGLRYVENDVNRMFDGAYQKLRQNSETKRAEQLEQVVAHFFNHSDASASRYHFDLHTAIRTSLLPTFALFPYQTHAYDQFVLQCLASADLDAVVFHNALGHTFSHFSSYRFQAASVTLELGQAKAFGKNDLGQFNAIDQVLRAVITEQALSERSKQRLRQFKVIDSIVKTAEDFQLNVADDVANFSDFQQGEVIATQGGIASDPGQMHQDYVVQQHRVFLLFPNANVQIGLRAGLLLEEI